jgi:hypothetical protein
LLKWTWHDKNDSPTVQEIEDTLNRLKEDLLKDNAFYVATGGLFFKKDKETKVYSFGFEIEEGFKMKLLN